MSKVEVKLVTDKLRIYINDLLHLSISTDELVGIHAFKYGEYRFLIDYNMKTTIIKTSYVRKDHWEQILKGLHEIDYV